MAVFFSTLAALTGPFHPAGGDYKHFMSLRAFMQSYIADDVVK